MDKFPYRKGKNSVKYMTVQVVLWYNSRMGKVRE